MGVRVPLIWSNYVRLTEAVLYQLMFKCLRFKCVRPCLLGLARYIKTQLTFAIRRGFCEVSVTCCLLTVVCWHCNNTAVLPY